MALGKKSVHHLSLAMSLSWLSHGTEKPLLWAAFSHFGVQETVQIKVNSPQKTAVYIVGYNLYYGRLRGTALKWLDVVKLFQNLLTQRDQNESLERITIFTAHALVNFASHGQKSAEAQASYHRALKTLYPDKLEIVYKAFI